MKIRLACCPIDMTLKFKAGKIVRNYRKMCFFYHVFKKKKFILGRLLLNSDLWVYPENFSKIPKEEQPLNYFLKMRKRWFFSTILVNLEAFPGRLFCWIFQVIPTKQNSWTFQQNSFKIINYRLNNFISDFAKGIGIYLAYRYIVEYACNTHLVHNKVVSQVLAKYFL